MERHLSGRRCSRPAYRLGIQIPITRYYTEAEATPVIEQLVNDGLLTPARALVLLS